MKRIKKLNVNDIIQQGDVIITSIDALPEAIKPLNHNIIAIGKATGHSHTIIDSEFNLYEDDKGTLWLDIKSNTAVVQHQEHEAITFPRGKYKISKVMEYDHFLEESKEVRD